MLTLRWGSFRHLLPQVLLVIAIACTGSTETSKPSTIEFTSVTVQGAVAGQALTNAPAIVVKDQNGSPLANVAITVAVTGGGGTLTGQPVKTVAGPTPIGTWTLGPKVGTNTITVTVGTLAPVTFSVQTVAGPPANFTTNATSINGVVGTAVTPIPTVTLVDANNNPIAGAPVTISVGGGGQATAAATTDANGNVAITSWTLGTAKGLNTLTLTSGSISVSINANARAGAAASLVVLSGNNQTLPGGSVISPIVVRAVDSFNNGLDAQNISVFITQGGGSLASFTATDDKNGTITINGWALGKSAIPQGLRIVADALTTDITATVQTSYNIEIRFFGPDMPADQRAAFERAAQRISAIITGDIINAQATNFNVAGACGVTGAAPLNELIDDVVIYASIIPIDGPNGTLAQASPCAFRSQQFGFLPAVGFMQFDQADVAFMVNNNIFQNVVTHEMLHVLGVGQTLWNANNFLINVNTPTVGYTGSQGRQGCVDSGGIVTCGASVPVENVGGPGSANTHWRESVFGNELMTSQANLGDAPFSMITIGSLADIGYVINPNAQDFYKPSTLSVLANPVFTTSGSWENNGNAKPVILNTNGTVEPLPAPAANLLRLR